MEEKEKKSYIYKVIVDSKEKTLLYEARRENKPRVEIQSERELEEELLETLKNQNYEYIHIRNEEDLIKNLRKQIEKLNAQRISGFRFTDEEWSRFYRENFEGVNNLGVENRTKKIQGSQYKKTLKRESGEEVNIDLIDKRNSQNNSLQVINQFRDQEKEKRYDVTILVNGLPLVHIELKRRGVPLEEAFYQIERYKETGFSSLFEFIQIFIISNGTFTRYYSNTTRSDKKNSYLFTSTWSRPNNENINDLIQFAQTFLSKETLLEVLTKYCVFDCESNLKILRPYQVAAVVRILEKIRFSINHNAPNDQSGGYIWHTTGSGKTLTSFKAAQLAHKIKEVKKVLFIVDRKDLCGQTYKEYRNFLGKDAAETIDDTPNTNTLRSFLRDDRKRIIITTIQKLRKLMNDKGTFEDRAVIIMDECHRSQTEDVHREIAKKFKKRNLFGFTGTPLFDVKDGKMEKNITQEIFGKELHSYKITDAIEDSNVLRFWVDYVIDREKVGQKIQTSNKYRIREIVKYIIDQFETKTNPSVLAQTLHDHPKTTRFNSMLATESISTAMKYYREFEEQLKEQNRNLKVAIIYSAYADTKEPKEKSKDFEDLTQSQKKFLSTAIEKYERQFNCRLANFNAYRDDVAKRIREREIDILIVVNMFLTGFDAPRLNTLWVDKNLDNHNLIQAFSRTNRNYDKSKPHGNIICFRDLKKALDLSLACYVMGDKKAFFVEDFETRMEEHLRIEDLLLTEFPLERLGEGINGPLRQRYFIEIYKKMMKSAVSLSCDERFREKRKLTPAQLQDYKSVYYDLYQKYKDSLGGGEDRERSSTNETTDIGDDEEISFELEMIRSEEVDIDYIIEQISKYSCKANERETILKAVRANLRLRQEEETIVSYLDRIDAGEEISYKAHKKQMQDEKLNQIIETHRLNAENTRRFFNKSIEIDNMSFAGKSIKSELLPKFNLRTNYNEYKALCEKVKSDLLRIFDLFRKY